MCALCTCMPPQESRHLPCDAAITLFHLQNIPEELQCHTLSERNLLGGPVAPHNWSCLGILHHQQQLVCLRIICMSSNSLTDICMLQHLQVAQPTAYSKAFDHTTAPELKRPKIYTAAVRHSKGQGVCAVNFVGTGKSNSLCRYCVRKTNSSRGRNHPQTPGGTSNISTRQRAKQTASHAWCRGVAAVQLRNMLIGQTAWKQYNLLLEQH